MTKREHAKLLRIAMELRAMREKSKSFAVKEGAGEAASAIAKVLREEKVT